MIDITNKRNYRSDVYDKYHESLVGLKFSELTLLRFVSNGKYEFLCSCGVICVKRLGDVKRGRTKSCGHLKLQQRLKSLVGQRFGHLVAIEELDFVDSQRMYRFQCDCGNNVVRKIKDVKRGKINSCGCKVLEGVKLANTTHGMAKTRLYNTWLSMKSRCYDKNNKAYNYYGNRGISVCDEWMGDFVNFYNWSMANGYAEDLSIDRIDVNGNYEPSNCRWVDSHTQSNNKRSNIRIEYMGEIKTLSEWASFLGVKYSSLYKRIHKYSYSIEKAFTYNLDKIREGKGDTY